MPRPQYRQLAVRLIETVISCVAPHRSLQISVSTHRSYFIHVHMDSPLPPPTPLSGRREEHCLRRSHPHPASSIHLKRSLARSLAKTAAPSPSCPVRPNNQPPLNNQSEDSPPEQKQRQAGKQAGRLVNTKPARGLAGGEKDGTAGEIKKRKEEGATDRRPGPHPPMTTDRVGSGQSVIDPRCRRRSSRRCERRSKRKGARRQKTPVRGGKPVFFCPASAPTG